MAGNLLDDGINVVAPKAETEPEPVDESFDPGEHNIDDVKEYVESHPEEAEAVAEAERSGKGRVRLLAWLDQMPDDEPAGDGAEDTTSEEN